MVDYFRKWLHWYKLIVLLAANAVVIILVLLFVNAWLFQLHWTFPVFIFFLPFLVLLFRIVPRIINYAPPVEPGKRPKNFIERLVGELVHTKYNPIFPLHLYIEDDHQEALPSALSELALRLQRGDITMRRHDHYLDGLVLSQTSYFTHAGIYQGLNAQGQHEVIHAVSYSGVSRETLQDFCRGSHYVVLRFFPNQSNYNRHLDWLDDINKPLPFVLEPGALPTIQRNPAIVKQVELVARKSKAARMPLGDANDVRTFIRDDKINGMPGLLPPLHSVREQRVANEEGALYDKLTSGAIGAHELDRDDCLRLIMQQAETCIDLPYDYCFDFLDYKKLSCVELVWYCYKSLAPLLRIQRQQLFYFGMIRVSVIVPDMFLENPFFCAEYNSLGLTEKALIEHTRAHHLQFWRFYTYLVLCEIVMLIFFSCVYLLLKPMLHWTYLSLSHLVGK